MTIKIILLLSLLLVFNSCSKTNHNWETLENAMAISVPEGDLIKVASGNEIFEVRLYFADAPDVLPTPSRAKTLASKYKTNVENVPIFADQARAFVESLLMERPIIVTTRREPAPTNDNVIPRYYGFIHFNDPANRVVRELGEVLCRTGYATPTGHKTRMPNDEPHSFYLKNLEESRNQAFIEQRGIWAR